MATTDEQVATPKVEKAFALGWQVAELFHFPVHQGPAEFGEFAKRLSGILELAPAERSSRTQLWPPILALSLSSSTLIS